MTGFANCVSFAALALLCCVSARAAVPPEAEVAKARALVQDIAAGDVQEFKAGKLPADEAVGRFREYAEQAGEDRASAWLFLKLAFDTAVDGGVWEEGLALHAELSSAFEPPKLTKNTYRNLAKAAKKDDLARKLLARVDVVRLARKNLKDVQARLAKKPGDKSLTEALAVETWLLGDRKAAAALFEKAGGRASLAVAAEKTPEDAENRAQKAGEAAKIWWEMSEAFGQKRPEVMALFKGRAGALYAEALDGGIYEGLAKVAAEKRVEEAAECGAEQADSVSAPRSAVPLASMVLQASAGRKEGLVMVIPPCELQPVEWRYSAIDPDNPNWRNPGVSLASWKKGAGPFGNTGECRTNWDVRRGFAACDFTLSAGDPQRVKHVLVQSWISGDVSVFVNGIRIGSWRQHNNHDERRFDQHDWTSIFRPGVNRIAVELSNGGGGVVFDFGVCLSFDERPMPFSTAALPGTRKTVLFPAADQGPPEMCLWRYTTSQPPSRWEQPSFLDARKWNEAPAPFGRGVEPRPATDWSTPDIWLRKEVTINARSHKALAIHGRWDDDVEVWINGVKVFTNNNAHLKYGDVMLPAEACRALKNGKNVIAAKCHNRFAAQAFDIGLYAIYSDK